MKASTQMKKILHTVRSLLRGCLIAALPVCAMHERELSTPLIESKNKGKEAISARLNLLDREIQMVKELAEEWSTKQSNISSEELSQNEEVIHAKIEQFSTMLFSLADALKKECLLHKKASALLVKEEKSWKYDIDIYLKYSSKPTVRRRETQYEMLWLLKRAVDDMKEWYTDSEAASAKNQGCCWGKVVRHLSFCGRRFL
jgi:hypothetical protein